MGNPRTGHYECPRCKSREVYESRETTGAIAMSINAPGPIDPTLVNKIEETVVRCVQCREKSVWYDSAETKAFKAQRETAATRVIGFISGFLFLFGGLYILNEDLEGTTGLMVGVFSASAFFFLVGIVSR